MPTLRQILDGLAANLQLRLWSASRIAVKWGLWVWGRPRELIEIYELTFQKQVFFLLTHYFRR